MWNILKDRTPRLPTMVIYDHEKNAPISAPVITDLDQKGCVPSYELQSTEITQQALHVKTTWNQGYFTVNLRSLKKR